MKFILWQHVLLPMIAPLVIRALRAEIFPSTDAAATERSTWIYDESAQSKRERARRMTAAGTVFGHDEPLEYTTSALGILNGYLTKLGIVLVVLTTDHTPHTPVPPYLEVRARWW